MHNTCSSTTCRPETRSNKQRSVETCLLSFLFPLFPMHDTPYILKNTSVEIVCGWRDKCDDLPQLNFLSRRFSSSLHHTSRFASLQVQVRIGSSVLTQSLFFVCGGIAI